MTTAVSNDQKQKWNEAVTEFAQEIHRQYHGLDDSWTTALVEEVKALGLAAEYISKRSLMAAFRNCVGDKRIILPKTEPVLTAETIERIKASFPPIIKSVPREISQRDKSALAGISPQSARQTRQDRIDEDKRIENRTRATRETMATQKLRLEYLDEIGRAETIRENTHAKTFASRAARKKQINEDPKYASVRNNS